jgi:DNA modification methylase
MIDMRLGDCIEQMKTLGDGSVDAVVTDPPSGTHFMGKSWDHNKGGRDSWICWLAIRMAEALRVTKPGARALVWAIPRTSHWTGMAIEDAGWIIEDRVAHLFGQGFPKAKSKLKPACEDWWLARKPSKNVPPLNIDDCRVNNPGDHGTRGRKKLDGFSVPSEHIYCGPIANGKKFPEHPLGRWPANVALTCCGETPHLEGCPVAILDEQSGTLRPGEIPARASRGLYKMSGQNTRPYHTDTPVESGHARVVLDSGGASRFFYCSKASKKDRGEGNTHPTVKSTELLSWLIRLISDPGDTILDPFAGSGTTGIACLNTGRHFIGIESDPAYFAIAERRLAAASNQTPLFAG